MVNASTSLGVLSSVYGLLPSTVTSTTELTATSCPAVHGGDGGGGDGGGEGGGEGGGGEGGGAGGGEGGGGEGGVVGGGLGYAMA